jgi:hypothetical protein
MFEEVWFSWGAENDKIKVPKRVATLASYSRIIQPISFFGRNGMNYKRLANNLLYLAQLVGYMQLDISLEIEMAEKYIVKFLILN